MPSVNRPPSSSSQAMQKPLNRKESRDDMRKSQMSNYNTLKNKDFKQIFWII